MPDTVFSARALPKIYTSGEVQVHALRGLDLEISAREVVVLLGPSGGGKVIVQVTVWSAEDVLSVPVGALFRQGEPTKLKIHH